MKVVTPNDISSHFGLHLYTVLVLKKRRTSSPEKFTYKAEKLLILVKYIHDFLILSSDEMGNIHKARSLHNKI